MNTLKIRSECTLSISRSKFIGYAFPISSKEEFHQSLQKIIKVHPKANHYCTAFQLSQEADVYYLTNDDGEPRNSAGKPILGQLQAFDIINSGIVVVRYFGGTKLGVGGLIKAYRNTAKEAILKNSIIPFEELIATTIKVDYNRLGEVCSRLDQLQITYKVRQETKHANIELQILKEKNNVLMAQISTLLNH